MPSDGLYTYPHALPAGQVAVWFHAEPLRDILTTVRRGPRAGTRQFLFWPAAPATIDNLHGAEFVIEHVYAAMCGHEPKESPLEEAAPQWAVALWNALKPSVKQRYWGVPEGYRHDT